MCSFNLSDFTSFINPITISGLKAVFPAHPDLSRLLPRKIKWTLPDEAIVPRVEYPEDILDKKSLIWDIPAGKNHLDHFSELILVYSPVWKISLESLPQLDNFKLGESRVLLQFIVIRVGQTVWAELCRYDHLNARLPREPTGNVFGSLPRCWQ